MIESFFGDMFVPIYIISIIGYLIVDVYSKYKKRRRIAEGEITVVVLKGISFDWLNMAMICLFFFPFMWFLVMGELELDISRMIIVILFSGIFLRELIDVAFQLIDCPDRLIYGDGEICLIKSRVSKMEVDTINYMSWREFDSRLVVDGVSPKEIVRGVSFRTNRITEQELLDFIEYIDQKKGFENIRMTDNFKKRFIR